MENYTKNDAIWDAEKVIVAILFHYCAHGCPEEPTDLPKTCTGVAQGAHRPAQNQRLGIPEAARISRNRSLGIPKSTRDRRFSSFGVIFQHLGFKKVSKVRKNKK